MKAALLAAREALARFMKAEAYAPQNKNEYYEQARLLALIDAALAQPEWTLPHAVYTAFDDTTKLYTADQMRAAFEAGRMAG